MDELHREGSGHTSQHATRSGEVLREHVGVALPDQHRCICTYVGH